jgi:hypothetical protein
MLIKESPCNTCNTDKERCSATAQCTKWKAWFYDVWPIVTGKPQVEEEKLESNVVEVVRCKDCVYSCKMVDAYGEMRLCHHKEVPRSVTDDQFCSYGERKDNE